MQSRAECLLELNVNNKKENLMPGFSFFLQQLHTCRILIGDYFGEEKYGNK